MYVLKKKQKTEVFDRTTPQQGPLSGCFGAFHMIFLSTCGLHNWRRLHCHFPERFKDFP